jgi:hypothetical protein
MIIKRAPVATNKERRPSEARERRGREMVSAPGRRSRRVRSDKVGDAPMNKSGPVGLSEAKRRTYAKSNYGHYPNESRRKRGSG